MCVNPGWAGEPAGETAARLEEPALKMCCHHGGTVRTEGMVQVKMFYLLI